MLIDLDLLIIANIVNRNKQNTMHIVNRYNKQILLNVLSVFTCKKNPIILSGT